MSDKLPYQFKLIRLMTLEFAVIEKNFIQGGEINITTNLNWGAGDQRLIGVGAKFMFEIKGQPFIVLNVEGQFDIAETTWSGMLQDGGEQVLVHKTFLAHMGMLVVGSARGVLHAKLEQTPFNQLLIPTVNVQAMINEDVLMDIKKAL